MSRASIVIVTPALAAANNGNWQTANRWARMLAGAYRVRLASSWQGGGEDLMIALHARRSAAAVAAWSATGRGRPLVLVLTGTDLYRDIARDAEAQASLRLAHRLVVLNDRGAQSLPAALRPRCRTVLQSCSARQALAKSPRHLRAIAVGHLREEKSPSTIFEAARLLRDRDDIRLDHVGAALDPALGRAARALSREAPRYRWLGPLPHGEARRRIQAAHILLHPSRMEGGANVIIEAVRSGTPVLASDIEGNAGVLGAGYAGLFPLGDAQALASRLLRARDDPAMLPFLQEQCAARAPLFEPERERDEVNALVRELLAQAGLRGE